MTQRSLIQNWNSFACLMKKQNYDVLHLNIFQALPLAYLVLAKNKGISLRIAHSHNTMLRKSRTRALKMVIHRLARALFSRNASMLWACSEDAAKFMFPIELLKKREYQIVPNGIDLERFQLNSTERECIRRQLGLEDAFVIGNVGRLCEQKNQKFLLEVFAHIHDKDPSTRLLLIGEGEDSDRLKEKAERLQISDAVLFYGTTTEIERLFWAMDVFVFPSKFEGFGIVAIESQAAGLPTLCSDRVPKEALASNLACQVPLSASVEQWAKRILEERGKRKKENVVDQLITKGFDVTQVSSSILKTYLYS